MEVKTNHSKIAKFIKELVKESHPADIVALGLWIAGFCVWISFKGIIENTNLSLEIRFMYFLFLLVYIAQLAIFSYQTMMIHALKRIEQKIEQR